MNAQTPPSLTPRELVHVLVTKRTLWIAPAVVCGVLAAAYSLVMPRYWEASQALVVRQDTAGSQSVTPGKFADLYEMRTLQETILELAKSREVVVATIKAVDQRLLGVAKEPTAEDVEEFRKRLKMLPPHGGEFGKSEVFYFSLKDASRDRAIDLVGELCRQLETCWKQLRAARAGSLIAELEEQVTLANETQQQETKRLAEFETEVGADLGELRMLHSASSGQSDLRQEAVQLEADARKFETQTRESEALLEMLRVAEKDPQQLIATPNSLLVSQPALRRLKDGLVDAQLATAKLAGTRSAEHPRVQAAVEGEKGVRDDLHRELVTAIRGAEAEVRLGMDRVTETRRRVADVEQRLSRLAERRAEYSNRVAALENSRVTLDRVRQNLSTAKAAQAAAHSGSLVTRIDQPETGPYPAGPGRTVIAGAGVVGGLMLGLGLVFLTANPMPTSSGRPSATNEASVRSPRSASPTSIVGRRPAPTEPNLPPWPQQPLAAETRTSSSEAFPAREGSAPSPVVVHARPGRGSDKAPATLPTAVASAALLRANVESTAPSFAPTYDELETAEHFSTFTDGENEAQPDWANREVQSQASVAVAEPFAKKAVLPPAVGTLPSSVGTLPSSAAVPGYTGMSLQEALQAARQAQL